jgi:hypothetical protein
VLRSEKGDRVWVETLELPGSAGFLGSLRRFLGSTLPALLHLRPRVDFVFRQPQLGRSVREHYDPNLPVAGLATTPGSSGSWDIILAIDASASTNECAETDVDGDGVHEDRWGGDDSVFHAQLAASRNFVRALRRLPGNREGERIRVGLVTFAGDPSFYRRPEERHFEATPRSVLELANRDADLRVPLTSDYRSVERSLRDLSRVEPAGLTNFAAGIGRAIIELVGIEELGARSQARADAERVVQFMTDGKPRLPYDREPAERAAAHAARLAAALDVRINAFSLGRNDATRKVNRALRRIAWLSDGRLVELEDPGDIVSILGTTPFSFVDRIKLVNRSTDQESGYVGTGIDGSFYGEIPLREGENEIEVVAVLHDDRRASEDLTVDFRLLPPDDELVERLQSIRKENEALVEHLKERVTREMDQKRARQPGPQRRALEVRTVDSPDR